MDSPAIAAQAKKEGAGIHWGNETGLRSEDERGRCFAPKSETRAIHVNSQRHGLSIISTVTHKWQMRRKIFDGALNSGIPIDFLRRLIKGAPRRVFLILGSLRVHHSQPVSKWLAKHMEAIELFYLLSYDQRNSLWDSPELNPDEMADAGIKQAVTKRHLATSASHYLRSAQEQPARVRCCSKHMPFRYAA